MNRFTLLSVLLILGVSSATSLGQAIHYHQNFDNLMDGEVNGQDGWAVGLPGNKMSTIITSKVKHGLNGKSMEVSPNQQVIRDFDPVIQKGIHFLSIWFRFEAADRPVGESDTLHLYMGEVAKEWASATVIRIGPQSGNPNKIGVYDGAAEKAVGDIKVGEWQHIFQVMDIDSQTYTVYLDEEVIADNFSWRNPANHHGLGWLMLGSTTAGEGIIGYYDDVIFGEGDELLFNVVFKNKLAVTWGFLKTASAVGR